jgi:hypothetical protein
VSKIAGLALSVWLASGAPIYGQQGQAAAPAQAGSTAANLPDLTPGASGALSQEQMQKLFRVVADKDLENDRKQRDYTYIERDEEHKLDAQGRTRSTEVKTFEVMELYGLHIRRLIEKGDKALSQKDAAAEEERIRKIVDKRKNESEEDRQKRASREEKEREDGRKFVREVADAYNFRLVGTESPGGRDAWVIDAEPRPGYEPRMKDAKFLPKFRFRAWIDKSDMQWARLDIECVDTVALGLLLLRVHKGSRIAFEQTRVNGEVWLPRRVGVKIDARLALLKGIDESQEQTYRDYKKFRASANLVGVRDVQEK